MNTGFLEFLKKIDQKSEKYLDKKFELNTFGSLIFVLAFFSFAWAYAWNAHLIGPWLDQALHLSPSDLDTPGRVRWRRMWSTAICLPGILSAIYLYARNVWGRHKAGQNKSTTPANSKEELHE
jgi:hypothetical protein